MGLKSLPTIKKSSLIPLNSKWAVTGHLKWGTGGGGGHLAVSPGTVGPLWSTSQHGAWRGRGSRAGGGGGGRTGWGVGVRRIHAGCRPSGGPEPGREPLLHLLCTKLRVPTSRGRSWEPCTHRKMVGPRRAGPWPLLQLSRECYS